MPVDGFELGGGWFRGFAVAGCAASGFAVAGFAAAGLRHQVWWNQVWQLSGSSSIRYIIPMLLKPPVSPRRHNAMLPNPMCGKPWFFLVPFGRHDILLILIIN